MLSHTTSLLPGITLCANPGRGVLRAGRAPDAEKIFREGVKRSPRNGRMLFGLLESIKAQQKTEGAAWVEREFNTVWAKADVKLRVEDL